MERCVCTRRAPGDGWGHQNIRERHFPEGTNATDPFIATSWPPGQAEKLIAAASGPPSNPSLWSFFFMVAPGDFYRQGLGLDVEVCWSHSAGGKCSDPSVKCLRVGHILTGALSGGGAKKQGQPPPSPQEPLKASQIVTKEEAGRLISLRLRDRACDICRSTPYNASPLPLSSLTQYE